MITYKETKKIPLDQLRDLYNDVEWTAYTEDENILHAILPNALHVISAWDGEELVGLCRSIGDQVYITYIQDLLVKKAYQHQGIGSALLQKMLDKNTHVKQIVLLTSYEEKTMAFYMKNGLHKADNEKYGVGFVRYQ